MSRSSRLFPAFLLLAGVAGAAAVPAVVAPDAGAHRTSAAATIAPRDGQPESDALTSSTVGVLIAGGYRCTATVVNSDSGSVIATAGHCAYLEGRWQLDGARFVPGYHDGEAPYGVWDVEDVWVPQAWRQGGGQGDDEGGSPEHDIAFARLGTNDEGQTAEEALGSQGIRFDAPTETDVAVYGYPADGQYDGESLQSCTETTDQVSAGDGSTATEIDCGLTAGASGGPLLTGPEAADGRGWVSGVISMGSDDGRNFAAMYDGEAEQLFQAADRGDDAGSQSGEQ